MQCENGKWESEHATLALQIELGIKMHAQGLNIGMATTHVCIEGPWCVKSTHTLLYYYMSLQ